MLRRMLEGFLIGMLALGSPGRAIEESCPNRAVVILVDHSGSMARDLDPEGARWRVAARILEGLRSAPPAHLRAVSVLAFGEAIRVLLPPTDPSALPTQPFSQVKGLPHLGWSDLVGTLQFMEECATVVVLTDGVPQTEQDRDPEHHLPLVQDRLKALRRKGVVVVLILWATPRTGEWRAFQKAYPHWVDMANEGIIDLVEIRDPASDVETAVRAVRGALAARALQMTPTPFPSPTRPLPHPSPTPTAAIAATMASAQGSGAPPPSTPSPAGRPPWGGMALGLLVLAASLLFFIIRTRRPHPGLEGELLILRGPNGLVGRRLDLSALRRPAILGEDLDRSLPKRVARLEARRGKVWLIPLNPSQVLRNGQPLEGELALEDGMIFEIGPCLVRYENLKDRIAEWTGGQYDFD